jgi:hypothetical protein
MSLANRATTLAEAAFLRANGFYESPLESMGDYIQVDGETLYRGNWFHAEQPSDRVHFGPDEALEFLKARQQEFTKNNL